MSLQPGYNIVTKREEVTDRELPALAFLRRVAADEDIVAPVTVTGLEDLLYHVDEGDRDEAVDVIRSTLRRSSSIRTGGVVQFLLDGEIVHDDRFRLRMKREGEPVYLAIGELFVEQPQRLSPSHAVARK